MVKQEIENKGSKRVVELVQFALSVAHVMIKKEQGWHAFSYFG